MKNKLLWTITLLPIIITCIALQFMPDQVPLHYNIHGQIDRWGTKHENFILPVTIICFTLFWQGFLHYFKKKQNTALSDKEQKEAASNEKVIYIAAVGTTGLFDIMHCCALLSAYLAAKSNTQNMAVNSMKIISLLSGLIFIVLGNFMPKAKRNALVGLRTPWSMKNDQTWAVSNRFGGRAFILTGLLTMLGAVFMEGIASVLFMLSLLVLAGIACAVYSWEISKKIEP